MNVAECKGGINAVSAVNANIADSGERAGTGYGMTGGER
jgi:hypothetical protein